MHGRERFLISNLEDAVKLPRKADLEVRVAGAAPWRLVERRAVRQPLTNCGEAPMAIVRGQMPCSDCYLREADRVPKQLPDVNDGVWWERRRGQDIAQA